MVLLCTPALLCHRLTGSGSLWHNGKVASVNGRIYRVYLVGGFGCLEWRTLLLLLHYDDAQTNGERFSGNLIHFTNERVEIPS